MNCDCDGDSKQFFPPIDFSTELRIAQQQILLNMQNNVIYSLTNTMSTLKKVEGLQEKIDNRVKQEFSFDNKPN
jgi:hypothetical protein